MKYKKCIHGLFLAGIFLTLIAQASANLFITVGVPGANFPGFGITDPITGLPVGGNSLVLLIHDTDGDGPEGDTDLQTGLPINNDRQVAILGSSFNEPGTVQEILSFAPLNNAVDTDGIVNGETGNFYLRAFNTQDAVPSGEDLRWGDSYPNAVYTHREIEPDDPNVDEISISVLLLDQEPIPAIEPPIPPFDCPDLPRFARLAADFTFLNESQGDQYAAAWDGSFSITFSEDLLENNVNLFSDSYEIRPFNILEDKGSLTVRSPGPGVPGAERVANWRYFGLRSTPLGTEIRLTFISPDLIPEALTITLEGTFNDETPYTRDELLTTETIATLFRSGLKDITLESYLLSGNGNNQLGSTLPIDVVNETSQSADDVLADEEVTLTANIDLFGLAFVGPIPPLGFSETFEGSVTAGSDTAFLQVGGGVLLNGVASDLAFIDGNGEASEIDAVSQAFIVNEGEQVSVYFYGLADSAFFGDTSPYALVVVNAIFALEREAATISTLEDLCELFSSPVVDYALTVQTGNSILDDLAEDATFTTNCGDVAPLQFNLTDSGWHALRFADLPDDFRNAVGSLENVSIRVNGEPVPFGEDEEAFYFLSESIDAALCVYPSRLESGPRQVDGSLVDTPSPFGFINRNSNPPCAEDGEPLGANQLARTLIVYDSPQLVFDADSRLVVGGFSWPEARYFSHRGPITVVTVDCLHPVE